MEPQEGHTKIARFLGQSSTVSIRTEDAVGGFNTRVMSGSLVVSVALALFGCGGGGVTAPPLPAPTPTPTPLPPPRVVSQGSDSLGAGRLGRTVFNTTLGGRLDVTVDWTDEENDLDVFVAQGDCTFERLDAGQCPQAGSSEGTAKPEKLIVPNAPAGTYTLLIVNGGQGDESLSWQVVLTPGPAATSR